MNTTCNWYRTILFALNLIPRLVLATQHQTALVPTQLERDMTASIIILVIREGTIPVSLSARRTKKVYPTIWSHLKDNFLHCANQNRRLGSSRCETS